MEKRLSSIVKPEKAAKELFRVVETVTCLECCKFYILPETAICGHTLCHGCWIGRQSCPVCAVPLKRRTLKPNAAIKKYSETVQRATTLFEKLYNVKMEDFEADLPVQTLNKLKKDPSKNVNAWLCDSQNHFSAPVSSQLSTQAVSPSVEVKTCEIQVHTGSKKIASPTKIIHAPPPPQDDWDKIESVPDTEEFGKNKENVGPMDIEPFTVDDEQYTADHPRRSSRKKEQKSDSKPSETSVDKHSSSNISMDTDKLSRVKQNWSNVKKMRKEFSKLHRKKKNKLNVSIEMCKKTKSVISKSASSAETESQKIITIDDFTPDLNQKEKEMSPIPSTVAVAINNKHDSEDNSNKSPRNISTKDIPSNPGIKNNQSDKNESNEVDFKKNSSSILNNFETVNNHETETNCNNIDEKLQSENHIPFLKKSALQPTDTCRGTEGAGNGPTGDLINSSESTERVREIQTVNHVVNDNTETDSDDIQITIKVGNTLTNIFIKKKNNDVKVKLKTDQEAQTSLCMKKTTSCNTSPPAPENNDVQNIEINIGGDGVVSVPQQTKTNEPSMQSIKDNMDKTVSTKKNTASAETAPVEISASLEKELSKIMECDDDKINKTHNNKSQKISQKEHDNDKISNTAVSNKEPNAEVIELDEDIFASGSVKEGNVQLLKATKPAPSEILMPTLKQNKKQTQTLRKDNKRNRENDEELINNKKLKFTSEVYETSINDFPKEEENKGHHDESSINYDSVMGQVFASIDADMGDRDNVDKSQSIIKDNEDKTLIDKQSSTLVASQHSQFLKTQKTQRKVLGLSKMANASQNLKSNFQQKDSESLFALSNLESQILTEKGQVQKHGPETQAHLDNLLTPGICRDLASTECQEIRQATTGQECQEVRQATNSQEVRQASPGRECQDEFGIQATPQDRDDSDMSVCEETPQKASSFTRRSNVGSNSGQPQQKQTAQSQLHPNEAQIIKEIINISDSESTKTEKEITVVAKPKLTLETPTINQFCHSVQHYSTPIARKSLDFAKEPRNSPKSAQDTFTKPRAPQAVPKYCVAASCLSSAEVKAVETLCARKNWTFVKEYTKELTHLVVGVDEEGRSQRTVKFMCALAAGKWIVSYAWADAWMRRGAAAEEPFEALDWTSEPGPRRARTAERKLFAGFTFYCQPPFSVLSEPVLKSMLEAAGARVASAARDVRVAGPDVRLLLAEPEHTQENQFTYLALELGIVPVNYEWALNCLGSYSLSSVLELMLCPASLLPPAAAAWPSALVTQDYDANSDSDD